MNAPALYSYFSPSLHSTPFQRQLMQPNDESLTDIGTFAISPPCFKLFSSTEHPPGLDFVVSILSIGNILLIYYIVKRIIQSIHIFIQGLSR